ncbi:MAG: TonB-dependent receptor [Acidobacteria bacterium]|nr:TonB-dependent receptor [Acidobacteriota bacterium]
MQKFSRLFLFFIFLIMPLGVFAQAGATVSGKVTYTQNQMPIHNVSVKIVQLNRLVKTDEEGIYRFENVPPGRYTILTHTEGFIDSTNTIVLTTNTNATVNFALQIASLQEQVTVTASGTEQSVFDSFQTVNSVGSTRITEKAATSLGEVLENETGVAKRSFGPGTARPVIRGFDGDRVLVLQNGIRSGSVGSQSGDHGEPIDPLSAERIEIVKGPGTLLYGSNAIGGVINVIGNDENDAHKGFRGNFAVIGGTADRQGAINGGLEYGYRNWVFRGNTSAQRTDDYKTPLGRVPNSAARANTGAFGLGYFGEKAYLNGNYTLDVRRYGVPFATLFEGGGEEESLLGGEFPPLDETIDLRLRRHNFRVNGGFRNFNNSFLSSIRYNLDYTDYRHQEIETSDGVDEIGTVFDNKTFSYRSLFEQTKYKKLTGRFGFEGFTRDYEVNGAEQLITGEVNHDSFSVFGLEELNFERVKFQFGGRVETNRYNPANPDLLDRNFTGFSGALGVNVALWKGGAVIANYSNSYRAPALEELYNNGPHIGTVTFEIGNQNLRRERANGIDFSLRHLSDRFRITGDVYYYRINDFVYFAYQDEDGDGEIDIEDGLPVARYEQADAGYFGAELSADVTFNKYVGGFLSLDTVRAKLVDNDINLPRIPPARARIGLDLRYKGLSVRPEAIFAGRQDKVFPLETPTAGYGIVNLAGSYTIGRQHYAHVFSFNAYNLTDKLYRNHLSFIKEFAPEIGRGIRVGYTIRFF